MSNPTVLGLITARGGSKGIPRKNVLLLDGKPVIGWTIEAALASETLTHVIVSTDDNEIAEISRSEGAEVPFRRPARLGRDDTAHMDVVIHAIDWLAEQRGFAPDYVMLLQPTSPLRTSDDIDAAVVLAIEQDADSLISVCETHHHPYLIRKVSEEGTLVNFITGAPEVGSSDRRRQALTPAYFENGAIYLTKRKILIEERTFCPVTTIAYIMPQERSLQLDDAWDLHLLKLMLRESRSQATRSHLGDAFTSEYQTTSPK